LLLPLHTNPACQHSFRANGAPSSNQVGTIAGLLACLCPSLSHSTFDDVLMNPLALWASKRSQALARRTWLKRPQLHAATHGKQVVNIAHI
jgi:hypothetical protein